VLSSAGVHKPAAPKTSLRGASTADAAVLARAVTAHKPAVRMEVATFFILESFDKNEFVVRTETSAQLRQTRLCLQTGQEPSIRSG
jgi:hypothetical protein